MIIPDAKCVVNGSKVNATIIALNPLLNIEAKIANVVAPQVQYGKDEVQIIIPQASNFVNEELDVVDPNNTASTRWFITATTQGVAQPGNVQSAFPANKQMPAIVSQNRGKLKTQGGGGSQSNRSSLNRAAGVGSGSQITSTTPSQATPSQATPSQVSPSQETQARATPSSGSNVGLPAIQGDTSAADSRQARIAALQKYNNARDMMYTCKVALARSKAEDTDIYVPELGRRIPKRVFDPPSDQVLSNERAYRRWQEKFRKAKAVWDKLK